MLAILGFGAVVIAVALIGFFTLDRDPDKIQGQMEVEEYRVSSKVPGRVLEIRVKEGDYVNVGDTLAILEAPDINAKMAQAQSAVDAASAMQQMADNGARKEQIQGAQQLYEQAKVAVDITQKSYNRVQKLFDEGVVSAQKRDEAYAQYKAAEAQMMAAKSQYDMAVNGARSEDRRAAAAQVSRARGAVQEVNSYISETVQTAQMAGEVSEIYPKVGELKEIKMKVYSLKDKGSYAVWKATKASGQYDVKTFEMKARPVEKFDGLRPGMTLVLNQ